jgi:hypothetical protein
MCENAIGKIEILKTFFTCSIDTKTATIRKALSSSETSYVCFEELGFPEA